MGVLGTLKGVKMDELVNLVYEQLEKEKETGEMVRQLHKVIKMYDDLYKDLSKEQQHKLFELDWEENILSAMELDQAIRVTIEVIKKIYKN